jgi:hypothetical protein
MVDDIEINIHIYKFISYQQRKVKKILPRLEGARFYILYNFNILLDLLTSIKAPMVSVRL